MKTLAYLLATMVLMAGEARAGFLLDTSNPPGSPLIMTAGSVSGTMSLSVVSNNPSQDVMAAWNVHLEVIADAGATGTLTFQDPAIGTPPNPPSYVFGANGLGIASTNSASQLSANDFFDPGVGPGATVPAPGANLLLMDFLASPGAAGLFGIYAVQGAAFTQWTDGGQTTQFFTNVPDGTGTVRIGEVRAVPEPSSLVMLGLAGATLAGWYGWRQRK
jgi:PEP-CTERM motif